MMAREGALSLARLFGEMTEDDIRAYARTLPSVAETQKSRDVYLIGSDLVLKLAPSERVCRCTRQPSCACPYSACGRLHPEDYQECYCPPRSHEAYGQGQNEAEAAMWNHLNPELQPWFAEVYASSADGLWLIQEQVTPLTESAQPPAELAYVAVQVGIGDVHLKGTLSVKTQNCGFRRLGDGTDQAVIFDYGISRLWEEMTGERHLSLVDDNRWRVTYLPDA